MLEIYRVYNEGSAQLAANKSAVKTEDLCHNILYVPFQTKRETKLNISI